MSQNPASAQREWSLQSFRGRPSDSVLEALAQLARASEEADGNPPFNEQTWVQLRTAEDADSVGGVLAVFVAGPQHNDAEVAGAAVLSSAPDSPTVIEMVVRPENRGRGLGGELAAHLETAMGDAAVEAWSHGDDRAAAQLAQRHGLVPVRDLWRMRRKAAQDVDEAPLPEGVRLRAFEPGRDEQAWLEINAAAFAHHPEQGRMTLNDLLERERSDWFDPAGFLLAVDAADTVLGFHWTKVHPAAQDARGQSSEAVGEVYAVGISPLAQGKGLGKALTVAGLRHLASRGLEHVMLYVDADNEAAVALYRRLGFERWDADVMYARPARLN
ncbi:mycothiol synthase [Galactobacter caseinivorans]|uniref:Mycothiol acetyltransferase n=1 Tax=Galactobacter caseinivorans TaxID=2676123 RepID=A0A496PLV3_9MICC|nr:mycothiol synthase [Galactobacter caseinivorans]RKW71446.1 mycothiol synthase [Galactobacter caseinivorans]